MGIDASNLQVLEDRSDVQGEVLINDDITNVFGKALTTKGDMPLKVGKPDYDMMLAMVDDAQYERN